MKDDLISRQEIRKAMYHEAMEKDSDEQKWDSGCWIRYKMFERVLEALPSAQPYTEAEIQKMQDLEQAELEKAFELGKAEALSEIVRCKDCKHRPFDGEDTQGFGIEFPDEICPCQCEDGWYNWRPDNEWFCANADMRGETE